MYTAQLFLGIPLEGALKEQLKTVNPQVLALFVQPGENYLQQVQFEGVEYLGKLIDKVVDIPTLELLELNIHSLFKRILPQYPTQNPLCLFSVLNPPKL